MAWLLLALLLVHFAIFAANLLYMSVTGKPNAGLRALRLVSSIVLIATACAYAAFR